MSKGLVENVERSIQIWAMPRIRKLSAHANSGRRPAIAVNIAIGIVINPAIHIATNVDA